MSQNRPMNNIAKASPCRRSIANIGVSFQLDVLRRLPLPEAFPVAGGLGEPGVARVADEELPAVLRGASSSRFARGGVSHGEPALRLPQRERRVQEGCMKGEACFR